ncbi:MAG: hypothetical protein EBS64_03290 [Verrucomicrobia bacterium]|nr:hypothetical protein [Verrucomicrobiota bacterium]
MIMPRLPFWPHRCLVYLWRTRRHAVMAGALAGGGFTVIANAPNPAGQSILAKHFDQGVSPLKLALWAVVPTAVAVLCFIFIR